MKTNLTGLALLALVSSVSLVSAAMAQNTTDDWKWVVDHHKTQAIWDSACDHREIGKGYEQRCYVRVVDVYALRPDFGAAFVFLTRTSAEGLRFEFSFEKGTEFEAGGFAIMQGGEAVFDYSPGRCEGGTKCVISGDEAGRFAETLASDATIRLAFTDRSGREWERQWSAEGFAGALADLTTESAKRGL